MVDASPTPRRDDPGGGGVMNRDLVLNSRACALGAALVMSLSALAGPGAHGPGGEHLDSPIGGNATGLARLPDGSVNVPKLAQRRIGVRTRVATEIEAAATVEIPGRVIADPNALGRVQATYGGRLESGPNGLPVTGQRVSRGQVLAHVRHNAEPFALANQQAQLAELRSSRALAAQRVGRLESLEGTVPRKELEAARADLVALTERERSIGASLGVRDALIAPVSGVIARAEAVAGQIVEARDVLYEILDPGRVLVEAVTADATLPTRIGSVEVDGLPGVRLDLVGASPGLRDGMLPLTFRLHPNAAGAKPPPLAAGQPLSLVVALRERTKGIVLPAEAVVRGPANEAVVWIKTGAERYLPQPVVVRALDARTVLVVRGLAPDNRVVVEGAALIAQIR